MSRAAIGYNPYSAAIRAAYRIARMRVSAKIDAAQTGCS